MEGSSKMTTNYAIILKNNTNTRKTDTWKEEREIIFESDSYHNVAVEAQAFVDGYNQAAMDLASVGPVLAIRAIQRIDTDDCFFEED